MKLVAGKRFRIPDDNTYIEVVSGKVEVYAVTRKKISFRRIFLMELGPGRTAFPPMDEFEQIDILIHAVEDAELEPCPMAEADVSALRSQMKQWFASLLELSWLRLLADRGDDVLKHWENGNVPLGEGDDRDALLERFGDNEGIFAMLLVVRFGAQDEKLSMRMEKRARQKRRIVEQSIAQMLGEETVPEDDDVQGNAKLEDTVFLVRCAAQALDMAPRDVHLAPEMAKKLDQLGMIRRLVQKGGMQMRFVTLPADWHTGDSGVLLGYYGEKKQLAAFLPEAPERYRMVTREYPEGVPVTDKVAKDVDKDAFILYAGFPGQKLTGRDFLRFFFRQSWRIDWKTVVAVSVAMGLIPLITPVITETIFKDIIPILDRKGLATVTQVAMVSGFTLAALGIVRSVAFLRLNARGGFAAKAAMIGRMLSLPTSFFRNYQSGDIANRMMGLEQITQLLSGELVGTLFSFIFSFWSLGLMLYYSVKLTAVAVAIWLVYFAVSMFLLSRLVDLQRKMTVARNKTSGILQQIFTGLTKFRVKGSEEYAYHLWSERFSEEWKWDYEAGWLRTYNDVIAVVQPILLALALYYFGIRDLVEAATSGAASGAAASPAQEALGISEPLTVATFIAFQAAYTGFNASLNSVMQTLEQFSVIKPLLENIRPFLEAEPESADDKLEADVLSGAFEVRNLTFSYGEGLPDVLRDISFRVAAGEHVAIVGKSGCGKSTLIRLLLGFEQPKSGAVYYDGQDLSELSLPSVRSQMGVVLQNGQLMTGDIYRNIIGVNDLTLDDAWAAAEAAGVADDIREMPMQMQTMVSEGSTNISGGQRQRILIAKALAMKPSIIVCDEATSALDNHTQAIVTRSLDKLKATRIVVAHRLSTIRHADRIIVLDQGRIAESGTFKELVAKGGLFASFVKRQVA